jgi:hypothetical protein
MYEPGDIVPNRFVELDQKKLYFVYIAIYFAWHKANVCFVIIPTFQTLRPTCRKLSGLVLI